MAKVYITVWEGATSTALGGPIQYTVATIDGANSVKITGLNRLARKCRLYAEADCWVKWGENPTATGEGDSIPLSADNPEYYDLEAGFVITAIART